MSVTVAALAVGFCLVSAAALLVALPLRAVDYDFDREPIEEPAPTEATCPRCHRVTPLDRAGRFIQHWHVAGILVCPSSQRVLR